VKTFKLAIVGTGHVGSYVLADAMKLGLFSKIGLIDREKDITLGEALDQEHATALPHTSHTTVTYGSYEQCSDADIIVISASEKLKQEGHETGAIVERTELTNSSSKIIREVMGEIVKQTKEAIIICITNPVDIVTYIAENEFDYPQGKIFGTGTMLDSARLRRSIADNYEVDPKSVTGFMMGEHGSTAFPVLSHLNISGIPFDDLNHFFTPKRVLSDPEAISEEVVKLAYDIYWGKGWTNAAIAQATITLIKAILLDEKTIHPVSVTLKGEYGYNNTIATSLPCIIGENGIEARIPVKLNEWEMKKFHKSAEYVQGILKQANALK